MRKQGEPLTEAEVGIAILRVAARQPDGLAVFRRLLREIPRWLDLSDAERFPQDAPRGRAEWERIARGLKDHADQPGNILHEGYAERIPRLGYRITDAGRAYLKQLGC